jgi:uncharacterized membrane protein
MKGLNLKDNITTILAVLMIIGGTVNAYIQANAGQEINWYQLVVAVVVSVVAYFTGKNPDGTTKVIDPATGQQEVK